MLSDFFRLNTPFEDFDEEKLSRHCKISRDLRSVLYRPDNWPSELRRVRSSYRRWFPFPMRGWKGTALLYTPNVAGVPVPHEGLEVLLAGRAAELKLRSRSP
jgi:hypothetical protein